MRHPVRVAAALAATLPMLAVPPAVLAGAGWPLTHNYDPGYLWLALRSASLPVDVLAAGLVVVCWAAWGMFAVLTLADVVALARGRSPRMTPLRLLAVTSLSTVLASPSSAGADAAPAPAAQAAAPAPQETAQGHDSSGDQAEEAPAHHHTRTRVLSGFALGSARVDTAMRDNLDPLISLVGTYTAPDSRITVTGHTDASGPADYNQTLSRQRAEAVAEVLRAHAPAGVEVATAARGESDPRYEDGARAGPEAQRRVEITYTLAPPPAPTPADEPTAEPTAEPEPSASGSPAPAPAHNEQDPEHEDALPPAVVIGGVAATSAALGAVGGRLSRRPRTPAPSAPRGGQAASPPPPSSEADEPADGAPAASHSATPESAEPEAPQPVLDARHRLRLAATAAGQPVRVPVRGGLSLQGRCADEMAAALALACLQAGHAAVLPTHLAQRLGLGGGSVPRLRRAADTEALLLHAEAHRLGQARLAAETNAENPATADSGGAVLAVFAEAPDTPGHQHRLEALAQSTGLVVVVVGQADLARGVACERDDVLHITVDGQTHRLDDLSVATLGPDAAASGLTALATPTGPGDAAANPSEPQEAPATAPRAAAAAPAPAAADDDASPAPPLEEGTRPASVAESPAPPAPASEQTTDRDADGADAGPRAGAPVDAAPAPPAARDGGAPAPFAQEHTPSAPAEAAAPTPVGEQTTDREDGAAKADDKDATRAAAPPTAAPPAAPPRVRVQLFAPRPAVCVEGGEEIATGLRSSARLLLGLLALRRREGAGTEEITEVLEVEPAAAKTQRTAAVSNARAMIRTALGRPEAEVITHRAGRYRLDEATVGCDVWDFDDALAAARTTTGPERLEHLARAVEAYRAPLLGGLDHPLIEAEREQRRRAASSACVEAAHLADDTSEELAWLERARDLDQHNEAVYQDLMRAHTRNHRPDEVARVYALLQQALEPISAEPSPASAGLLEELTSLSPAAAKKPVRPRPRRR